MQGMIKSVLGYARSTVLGTKRYQENAEPQVQTILLFLTLMVILAPLVALVTKTMTCLLNMTVSR